jgi:hypothetical protein
MKLVHFARSAFVLAKEHEPAGFVLVIRQSREGSLVALPREAESLFVVAAVADKEWLELEAVHGVLPEAGCGGVVLASDGTLVKRLGPNLRDSLVRTSSEIRAALALALAGRYASQFMASEASAPARAAEPAAVLSADAWLTRRAQPAVTLPGNPALHALLPVKRASRRDSPTASAAASSNDLSGQTVINVRLPDQSKMKLSLADAAPMSQVFERVMERAHPVDALVCLLPRRRFTLASDGSTSLAAAGLSPNCALVVEQSPLRTAPSGADGLFALSWAWVLALWQWMLRLLGMGQAAALPASVRPEASAQRLRGGTLADVVHRRPDGAPNEYFGGDSTVFQGNPPPDPPS